MSWNPTTGPTSALVDADAEDGILTLTVNRPHKANALSAAVFRDLNAAVSAAHSDDSVRCVIVTGAGRTFSAGADVAELENLEGPAAYEFAAAGQFVFDQLADLPVPVIAAINGAALGGGLELALACDLRIASEGARFGQPEITLANTPGWGGTQRLPRTIGMGRAMAMMLTGLPIDAATALDYGLITEVVPEGALIGRAEELARLLATRSPRAVSAIKQAVRIGQSAGADAGQRAERLGVQACCGSGPQREAVRSFLARHRPDASTRQKG
ncbi:enoyl-CoA hydratase/isomerase family protein [Microbacterium soli]|uniref:Enoyl-CoA hydratase-related protein n=1 Tax=Microbacterium soli TaxID=446075 RepID=A0ABP7MVN0_9MICO